LRERFEIPIFGLAPEIPAREADLTQVFAETRENAKRREACPLSVFCKLVGRWEFEVDLEAPLVGRKK
jgi:hypothetical protein